LALEADEDLPLPALAQVLDPLRRNVDRHAVLEPRAEQGVDVRVRRPAKSAVLMDRKDALGAPKGAAERPLDGVAQDALRDGGLESAEALRSLVVDSQDEAEVGRVSESVGVVSQRLPNGNLIAAERAVARPDSEELAPLSAGEAFLAV
jgi:hypothetical protein